MRFEVTGLTQHYGTAQILREVAFDVPSGQCLAIMGRNGAGKTTLLRTLIGDLPATDGDVRLDGQDISDMPAYRRARTGIGYVPQEREIFADLTVGQNIQIAGRACGVDDLGAAIETAVEPFPVLREMWGRRGGNLSGGQQQQLAFARAIVTQPQVILLDEPTEGIQPSIVQLVQDVIAKLQGRMTVLLVEQYFDFAKAIADRYVVLQRGTVVAKGLGADMETDGVRDFLSV